MQMKRRPALGKTAYKARLRAVLNSMSAQRTARNMSKSLFHTCQEVVRKRGAASSG